MILSNNPRTCVTIMIDNNKDGSIQKKYRYRWAGPSSARIFNICLPLWGNTIKKLRSNL